MRRHHRDLTFIPAEFSPAFPEFPSLEQYSPSSIQIYKGEPEERANKDFFRNEEKQKNVKAFLK